MTTEVLICRNGRDLAVLDRTHMPKLNQCSTYRSKVGWAVEYTARHTEAENPRSEHKSAMYLGTAAEYPFWVSSVAMPSSSWYNLEVSSEAVPLRSTIALLYSLRKVGVEIRNTRSKVNKPKTREGHGERSIGDKEIRKRVWKLESMGFLLTELDVLIELRSYAERV